jgi:hypothetical protein
MLGDEVVLTPKYNAEIEGERFEHVRLFQNSCVPLHEVLLDVFSCQTLIIDANAKSAVISCCSISFLVYL